MRDEKVRPMKRTDNDDLADDASTLTGKDVRVL